MLRRLLAALALALPGSAAAAPITVLLLGDSITEGLISDPVGPSYASLLADSLGAGFEVANLGCGGASSLDWTRSRGGVLCGSSFTVPNLYEALALPALPADLVTILLGTNDAIGFSEPERVEPSVFRAAIEELVGDLLADGARQVLLMTPPPNYRNPVTNERVSAYRNEILSLCGAPGDALLCGPDIFALLVQADFAEMNVHPNGLGQAKIASALHDAILTAVPEPRSAPLTLLGLAALAGARRRRARYC